MFFSARGKFVPVAKILTIFDRREELRRVLLLGMIIPRAGPGALGIGVVASFVAVISRPELLQNNTVLRWFYEASRASNQGQFVTYLGIALCVVFAAKNGFLGWLSYSQAKFAYNKELWLSQQLFV